MKLTAGRTFLLWLLAMLAGAAIVWNSRFTADMSFFLPAHPTAEQQVLVDQLKEGVVSRLLMVAIEGGDEKQRADLSRALRGRLEKLPDFVSVQNGEAGSQTVDRDFLFKHRYLLSPAVNAERFTVDGLKAIKITDPWAPRDLQLCVRSRAALSSSAAALFDHLASKGSAQIKADV